MVFSMTAFARCDRKYTWGNISWEIRSLNKRYLDIFIDIPKYLDGLFWVIREKIKSFLIRGKIECYLNLEICNASISEFNVNEELVHYLIVSAKRIQENTKVGKINPLLILSWPGVVTYKKDSISDLNSIILQCLDETLCCLMKDREREGRFLQERIVEKLSCISIEVEKMCRCIPDMLNLKRKNLLEQMEEYVCVDDRLRLEQVLLGIIQKMDISEEIDRLNSHINAANNIFLTAGSIGRRLDFISQELLREINTISAKSMSFDITQSAISVKVFIEQIREQVQNLE